jgi:hypothetical protein
LDFRVHGPQGVKAIRLPQWAMILVAVAAAAVGIVLFVLAASVALIVLPVVILAGIIGGWWMRRKMRKEFPDGRSTPRRGDSGPIIDGEFKVLPRSEKS